jgi:hypothetical protein
MPIRLSVTARNARLDAVEAVVGASALLRIFTGAPPLSCAAADSGTLLVEMALPADWMDTASGGSKIQAGTWSDPSANGSGTAGYFRLYETTGTTCHLQGTCSGPGGGGDMELNNPVVSTGQLVQVISFTLLDGNA